MCLKVKEMEENSAFRKENKFWSFTNPSKSDDSVNFHFNKTIAGSPVELLLLLELRPLDRQK